MIYAELMQSCTPTRYTAWVQCLRRKTMQDRVRIKGMGFFYIAHGLKKDISNVLIVPPMRLKKRTSGVYHIYVYI